MVLSTNNLHNSTIILYNLQPNYSYNSFREPSYCIRQVPTSGEFEASDLRPGDIHHADELSCYGLLSGLHVYYN